MIKYKILTRWSAFTLATISPIVLVSSCSTNDNKNDSDSKLPPQIIPSEKPNLSDLWLSAGSENLNGLKIDRYANVVKQLQLSASDQISQYNNQNLTNRLWDGTNLTNDYQIEIVSGDTSQGKLSLKLIRPNLTDELINISGFYIQAPVYHQYQNFELNFDQWFEKLLPITISSDFATAIEKIDSETWNEVINDGYVTIYDKATLSPLKTVKFSDLKTAGYQFEIKAKINQSEIRLDIKTFMYGYVYQNQTWVVNQDSLEEIVQNYPLLVQIPTISDAKTYLMKQISYNQDYAKTILPSSVVGQINGWQQHNFGHYYDDKLIVNPLTDENHPFKMKYFKKQKLTLKFNPYQYQLDDQKGTLNVNLDLMIDGNPDGWSQSLKIDEMMTNESLKTYLQTTTDQWLINDGSWKTTLIANLKREPNLKTKIDQYFQNSNSSWSDSDIAGEELIHPQLNQAIFSSFQNQEAQWTWLTKQFGINFTLFSKPFDADFVSASPLAIPEPNQYLYYNNLININNFVVGIDILNLDFTNLNTKIVAGQNRNLILKFEKIKINLQPFGLIDPLTSNLTISMQFNQNDWLKLY